MTPYNSQPRQLMEPKNASAEEEGQIFSDHQTYLSLVIMGSLVLGVPLALNMLWQLRVANESRKETSSTW